MTAEELITFEGVALVFHQHDGRPCLVASSAGRALGYASEGRALADVIRREWSAEMIRGRDFDVLEGEDLREFKARAALTEERSVSANARSLMVLYESGWDIVCTKTEKPEGVRLRRFIVENVLPKLRRGMAVEPIAPALPPAPSTALVLAAPAAPVLADVGQVCAALVAGFRDLLAEERAARTAEIEGLHRRLDIVQKGQHQAALTQGIITAPQVEVLRQDVRALAERWVRLGWKPSVRAAALAIAADLHCEVDWGHGEANLARMPAGSYGKVLARLARLKWEAGQAEGRERIGRPSNVVRLPRRGGR